MAELTRTEVTAPDRAPVQYGLFSVLTFRNSGRWTNGVTWEGATCGPASLYDLDCPPPEAPDPVRPDRPLTWGEADAVSVEGTYTCTPVGMTLADIENRAVADLQLHEEAAVEAHVWGRLTGATGLVTLTPVETSPKAVIGALERHAALSYGYQGVIHLPRHLAPLFEGVLEVRQGRLVTMLGTPVVAGAGYGPENGLAVYVSPALLAYRNEAQIVGNGEQMFDRATNTMTALAQRDYLVGIDTCPIATASITLGTTA